MAAHPVRHFYRLGADVVEAVVLHLRDRPVDGVLERLGSAQAMAEGVAEQREAFPGERTGERLGDQPGGAVAIGVEPAGGLREWRRCGEAEQGQQREPERPPRLRSA